MGAVLPQTMLFVTLAEPERVCMPPPPYPPLAEFPVIVQLITVAPEMPLATPPPSRLELPEIVQPISVGEASISLMNPPPAHTAVLRVIAQATMVGELPEHTMPPPKKL